MEHPVQSPKGENKRNGKPISLYPLDFEEAVEGLLATKPPPREQPTRSVRTQDDQPRDSKRDDQGITETA